MSKQQTTLEEDRQAYHRARERADLRSEIRWALAFASLMASWILADQVIRPWLATFY